MNKIFAVLAILVLAGSMSFAYDEWENTQTGTLKAEVLCLPTLTIENPDGGNLGYYFDDYNGPIAAFYPSVTWRLKGSHLAGYDFYISGPTPKTGTSTTATLTGKWYLNGSDMTAFGTEWLYFYFGENQINCTDISIPIVFDPTDINTVGAIGTQTWEVTLRVFSSI